MPPLARAAGLFLLFAAVSLVLLWPAVDGPFVSDDAHIVVNNPFTRRLDLETAEALFDPTGYARFYTANYAPIQQLAHALEVRLFGTDVRPYHLVNIGLHALNAVLLVALLIASRAPTAGAVLAGLLFAVHPALVEAVAWISQLKTTLAFAFAAAALLAFRRLPALATLCFACGLLTKPMAAFALPTAAAFAWTRRGAAGGDRRAWAWIGLWTVALALYAVPQMTSFREVASLTTPSYPDPWVHLRTIAALGGRYLVMAATSFGISAWHEPEPATSPLDPWWLFALVAGTVLGWRAISSLLRRREEAAWWVSSAAAFLPVSQIFPFFYPLADRYLYFILPGLLGGTLLFGAAAARELAAPRALRLRRGASLAALALAAFFGVRSHERAALYADDWAMLRDAARNYPEGETANYMRACDLGMAGDAEGAVALLRKSADRGMNRVMSLAGDSCFDAIRETRAFRDFAFEMAGRWIETETARASLTHAQLRGVARAHLMRRELAEARRALRDALDQGGPLEQDVLRELADVRAQIVERRRRARERRLEAASGPAERAPLQGAVLVLLDTLRADRVSAYGSRSATTPAIDALAADGVLFEHAISNAARTLPAVVGLLSGEYPSPAVFRDRLRVSLVEELAAAGVETAAVTEGVYVSAHFGMDRGFGRFVEERAAVRLGERAAGAGAAGAAGVEQTFSEALRWLSDVGERPFFLMIHSYEVHTPYLRPPLDPDLPRGALGESYRIEDVARVKRGELRLGPVELAYVSSLYDAGVAAADREVGRLLRFLDEQGLAGRTLVVVTSDHGEGLGERFPDRAGSHGHVLYDELVRVPLVLRAPGVGKPGQRVAETVRLVDVMPTVLELLGVDPPGDIEGRSLLPLIEGVETQGRLAVAGTRLDEPSRSRLALRNDRFKLIVSQPGALPHTAGVELYDLREDPAERRNLAAEEPLRTEQMRRQLELALRRGAQRMQLQEQDGASLPEDLREQLEELGYVE